MKKRVRMPAPPIEEYAEAFDRAVAGVQRQLQSRSGPSPETARRLARQFLAGRAQMAEGNPSVAVVDALVERAAELAGQNSLAALDAAELAVAVANRLDDGDFIAGGARLRAQTSLIARAKDVARFDLAESAADEAWRIFSDYTYTPDDEIDCLHATGYLFYSLDAVEEVFFFAEDALALARELGDSERVARSLKLLATAQYAAGEYRESSRSLWDARKITKDPRLRFACCQLIASNYCELGHYRAARSMLLQAEACSSAAVGADYELRLLWMRARVEAHLGDLTGVIEALEVVAEGFIVLGRPHTFGGAAIEIALLLAEHGSWTDAISLAAKCADWFRGLGMERDALAASAIAARVKGRTEVVRALTALSISVKKRAGRQSSPLCG